MDKREFVASIIERAHMDAQNLFNACEQMDGLREARQRLVSTYGKERVSSGNAESNPFLDAIIRYDNAIVELEEKVCAFNEAQEQVRNFVPIIRNRSYALTVEMYCLLGWSHTRISRSINRSVSTVKRRLQIAVGIIAQELSKNEKNPGA